MITDDDEKIGEKGEGDNGADEADETINFEQSAVLLMQTIKFIFLFLDSLLFFSLLSCLVPSIIIHSVKQSSVSMSRILGSAFFFLNTVK